MRLMPQALPRRPAPDAPALQVICVNTPVPTDSPATLCWGRFDSEAGPIIVFGAEGVLWALGLAGDMGEAAVRADLARRWPDTRLIEAPEALAPAISTLLRGSGEIRVRLAGTAFQMLVWRSLLEIPRGEVISYSALARHIGRPGAARAVGSAVGRNPVAWVVPCHRVVRESGDEGGYHWGPGVKRRLRDLERVPVMV